MEIRDLELHDSEALFDLVREVYDDTPMSMWFVDRPVREAFTPVFDWKMNGISAGRMVDIVAVEGDAIIGECEVVLHEGGVGMLGLIVSKNHRKGGIGSALLRDAVGRARGMGIRKLGADVARGNRDAIEFLSRRGFRATEGARTETASGTGNVLRMFKDT